MDFGKYQNSIPELPNLNDLRYENIFKMYKNDNAQYFYNITKTISLPENIDPGQIIYYRMKRRMPWTMVSFNLYNTIELWWLLCLLNNVKNPVKAPETGLVIKALNPDIISSVLSEIKKQLI